MKTRIISGVVMALIATAVLTVGYLWTTVAIAITISLLSGASVYEIIHNAAAIKNKTVVAGACSYAFLTVLIGYFHGLFGVVTATVLYSVYAAFMILIYHKEFDIGKIALVYGMPIPFALAFYCLNSIMVTKSGIYYLLLLLNFSCVCDMGAYFTGVTIGKRKLCPEISPKKTVEGAVGGIVLSMILTVIISLIFNKFSIAVLLLTIPFCILGMVGDLLASAIKRSVGLKDYSNLIPGHGGVLDRFDSMIMIAPSMFICLVWNV